MIHDLTVGYIDASSGLVSKPLEIAIVERLLAELGGTDDEGRPTLGGWKVPMAYVLQATSTTPLCPSRMRSMLGFSMVTVVNGAMLWVTHADEPMTEWWPITV